MSRHQPPRAPRIYRALLRLYPAEFRREFGSEIERSFTISLHDAGSAKGRAQAWKRALIDIAISVPREYWDTWVGDGRSWEMSEVLQDVRRATRGLIRTPGFSAVVVMTLALGIGATTSIFSVVYGVLLAPLPYPDADRIVAINEELETTSQPVAVSYVNASDWKAEQTSLVAIALLRTGALTLAGADGSQQLSAVFADSELFDILGTRAAIGRVFGPEDNRVPGGHPVAVLTHGAWSRLFAEDPAVVGTVVNLSGMPFTVIGVLDKSYRDPFLGANGTGNDLVVPAMMAGQIDPRGDRIVQVRRWRSFAAVGKLRPEVTAQQAEADLRQIAARLQSVYGVNTGMSASVVPFNEQATLNVRGPTLTVLAGALVLLLIACFNVANLLLVRGAARRGEFAVQFALGAGRARVLRLLTLESAVLALVGGALGIGTAYVSLPGLLGLIPSQLPPTADVTMNVPVLVAALALAVGAGVASGLIPALRQSSIDVRGSLTGAGRAVGDRRGERLRNGLVLFEIATATTLLAASALLIQSFRALSASDSGFVTENVMTVRINLPTARYGDDLTMGSAAEALVERVRALPGVEWAHAWGPGRPGLVNNLQTSVPDGTLLDRISDSPLSRRHQVTPGALEDIGLRLLQGRTITAEDVAQESRIAVISESMAKDLWPGEDALGKRYHAFQPPGAPIPYDRHWTVVGVVSDARHGGRVPQPGIQTTYDSYFPIVQRPERAFTLLVKTESTPDFAPIRGAIRDFDPDIPLFQVATMAENFAQEEGTSRFAAQLMGTFGLAALLLAALGVYGVISFTVAQRTREIGLRAALGARAGATVLSFLRFGLALAVGGVAVGVLAAYGATRGLQAIIPTVPDMQATSVALAGGALVAVALLACLVPAVRASRVAPVVALRGE